jgi:acetyltransferase
MAFASTPLPKGKRVGIMTESGGAGVLLTERCSEIGMEVPEIIGPTRDRLKEVVPSLGSVKNPVDLTGQSLTRPALVKGAIEVMLDSEDFDILVPLLMMSEATAEEKVQDLLKLYQNRKEDKSVVVCWPEGPKAWIRYLLDKGIHVSVTPTRCAHTLNALIEYAESQREYEIPKKLDMTLIPDLPEDRQEIAYEVIREARAKGETRLNEYDGKKLLRAYNIPTANEDLARSEDDALEIAHRIGYPLVVKLISPDIPHKTEAGVVVLNIESDDDLIGAYKIVMDKGKAYRSDARVDGVLIQEMISARGVETIIGISREDSFGPAILFGLGGIFVEAMEDVAIRVLPVTKNDVDGMIRQIKGYSILQGFRGRGPADLKTISKILLKTACLAQEFKDDIIEIDINPLMVLEEGEGARAVDALVLLADFNR